MFRRRRTSFLTVLPLLLMLVAILGTAPAAEAKPVEGSLTQLAWRWLAGVLNLGSMIDPNGLGPVTDPNGGRGQARLQETVSCGLGPMIDPDGRCGQARFQQAVTVSCGHGAMIDPNGRCVQSPGGT